MRYDEPRLSGCHGPQPGSAMLRCACAVPTAMGCSISAETCSMTEVSRGACTGDSAPCCSDTPCSTSRVAAAAAVHSCDFGTPTAAISQCVPEAAAPPASLGTSDADTVSTVFCRFCSKAQSFGAFAAALARAPRLKPPPLHLHPLCFALGNPCSWSSGAGAGRGPLPRTPCICS